MSGGVQRSATFTEDEIKVSPTVTLKRMFLRKRDGIDVLLSPDLAELNELSRAWFPADCQAQTFLDMNVLLRKKWGCEISSVYKNNNVAMKKIYDIMKEEMGGDANEVRVMHGCSGEAALQICSSGMNGFICSNFVWGLGWYASDLWRIFMNYCKAPGTVVFLTTNKGKSCVGQEDVLPSSRGMDTFTNDTTPENMICVGDARNCLPDGVFVVTSDLSLMTLEQARLILTHKEHDGVTWKHSHYMNDFHWDIMQDFVRMKEKEEAIAKAAAAAAAAKAAATAKPLPVVPAQAPAPAPAPVVNAPPRSFFTPAGAAAAVAAMSAVVPAQAPAQVVNARPRFSISAGAAAALAGMGLPGFVAQPPVSYSPAVAAAALTALGTPGLAKKLPALIAASNGAPAQGQAPLAARPAAAASKQHAAVVKATPAPKPVHKGAPQGAAAGGAAKKPKPRITILDPVDLVPCKDGGFFNVGDTVCVDQASSSTLSNFTTGVIRSLGKYDGKWFAIVAFDDPDQKDLVKEHAKRRQKSKTAIKGYIDTKTKLARRILDDEMNILPMFLVRGPSGSGAPAAAAAASGVAQSAAPAAVGPGTPATPLADEPGSDDEKSDNGKGPAAPASGKGPAAPSYKGKGKRQADESSEDEAPLQMHCCCNAWCKREPWNGANGEACCGTCKNTGGKSHGDACNERHEAELANQKWYNDLRREAKRTTQPAPTTSSAPITLTSSEDGGSGSGSESGSGSGSDNDEGKDDHTIDPEEPEWTFHQKWEHAQELRAKKAAERATKKAKKAAATGAGGRTGGGRPWTRGDLCTVAHDAKLATGYSYLSNHSDLEEEIDETEFATMTLEEVQVHVTAFYARIMAARRKTAAATGSGGQGGAGSRSGGSV